MNTKHTQAWAMLAQAIVNIDEGHTNIEPGSAVHDGMKDLVSDPVYEAAPELLEALKDTFDALLREKIAYNQRMGADYETAHKHALLSNDFAAARAAIAKATGNTSADL